MPGFAFSDDEETVIHPQLGADCVIFLLVMEIVDLGVASSKCSVFCRWYAQQHWVTGEGNEWMAADWEDRFILNGI